MDKRHCMNHFQGNCCWQCFFNFASSKFTGSETEYWSQSLLKISLFDKLNNRYIFLLALFQSTKDYCIRQYLFLDYLLKLLNFHIEGKELINTVCNFYKSSSNICRLFKAAPFRRLSATTQKFTLLLFHKSNLSLPTETGFFPSA